jgi:tetratricopeptide (TPR) repeat protein
LLRLDPDFLEALAYRAGARLQGGDVAGAADDYREVARRDEENPSRWESLSNCLVRKRHFRGAVEARQKLARLGGGYDAGGYLFADSLKVAGALAEELEILADIARAEPQSAVVQARYAEALQRDGKLDEAFRRYERAIKLDPANPRYLRERASLLLDRKRFKDAAADHLKALGIARDDLPGDLDFVRKFWQQRWGGIGVVQWPVSRNATARPASSSGTTASSISCRSRGCWERRRGRQRPALNTKDAPRQNIASAGVRR